MEHVLILNWFVFQFLDITSDTFISKIRKIVRKTTQRGEKSVDTVIFYFPKYTAGTFFSEYVRFSVALLS